MMRTLLIKNGWNKKQNAIFCGLNGKIYLFATQFNKRIRYTFFYIYLRVHPLVKIEVIVDDYFQLTSNQGSSNYEDPCFDLFNTLILLNTRGTIYIIAFRLLILLICIVA